jgi:hypothetical protein
MAVALAVTPPPPPVASTARGGHPAGYGGTCPVATARAVPLCAEFVAEHHEGDRRNSADLDRRQHLTE